MAEDMSSDSVELIEDNHSNFDHSSNNKHKTMVQLKNCIWKLASSEHSWATCPIGQLPWLIQKDNTTEMEI